MSSTLQVDLAEGPAWDETIAAVTRREVVPRAIRSDPLYRQLAAREGRDVFVDDPVLAGAMALSLPLVLDRLVPQLAAALDR